MWIFLPNSMLSIVQKPGDAEAGTLTVRARVADDIERVFPDAKVIEGGGTDYRFRANIPRDQVAQAMFNQVMKLSYSNFKETVSDRKRHEAYLRVWSAMFGYQQSEKR